MLLDIFGPNLPHSATKHGQTFVVHAAGCAHGNRNPLRSAVKCTEDHASLTALSDEIYPPDDFECESGAYTAEFYVAPCAEHLPYR